MTFDADESFCNGSGVRTARIFSETPSVMVKSRAAAVQALTIFLSR
jgi:hypothetical protein